MNRLITALLGAAIVFAASGVTTFAEEAKINDPGVNLEITPKPMPTYPLGLKEYGIFEGSVVAIIEIDSFGELRDYIILEASHANFANSLDRVLPKWDFTAPKVNGEPRTVITKIQVNFESSGDVVSLSISDAAAVRMGFTNFVRTKNYVVPAVDLDTIPQLINFENPRLPKELLNLYSGESCVFEFYVDKEGNVRMPAVREDGVDMDVQLLVAVQDALEQWKFQAPKMDGKPVIVRLAQEFKFGESSLASN